jgi:hypothetical protein
MMDATARPRRLLFFGLTLTTSLVASLLMLDILRANSLTVLEAMSLVLFFGLFTWIAGAFWTAIAGFIIRLRGGDSKVMQAHDADGLAIHSRIALVMPVYNEDPRRTTAGPGRLRAPPSICSSSRTPAAAKSGPPRRPPGGGWSPGTARRGVSSIDGGRRTSPASRATSPISCATGARRIRT